MKLSKIFKYTAAGLAATVALAIAACSLLDRIPAVPDDYTQTVQTGGAIEARYTAFGAMSVATREFPSGQTAFSRYKIWYPTEMTTTNRTYPAVVFANGTGVPDYRYERVFEHLASWGFIVIGNDDKSSWSGQSSVQSLDFLLQQNAATDSIFHGKVDTQRIGIAGHSQGGVGALNAASIYPQSRYFRSVFTASTTQIALANALKWSYDVGKIKVPYFAAAGTGLFDAGDGKDAGSGIAPLTSLQANQQGLPQHLPSVIARRNSTDHSAMLYQADGYMTVWFLYTLNQDRQAALAFTGAQAELRHNPQWRDVVIKNLP